MYVHIILNFVKFTYNQKLQLNFQLRKKLKLYYDKISLVVIIVVN